MAIALALAGAQLHAQPRHERGFPLVTLYRPEVHKGGPQNFSVAQDRRGILYFGNLGGVLAFDGAWWNTIKLPDESVGFAVAANARGQIVVGSVEDFGQLTPDARGEMHYHSLASLVPAAAREHIGDVRSACAVADGFILTSEQLVLHWDGGNTIRILRDDHDNPGKHVCFNADGKTYVAAPKGLEEIGGAPSPSAALRARFANRHVDLVLPGGIVAVTNEGLFTLDEKPFAPAASQWLKGKIVTGGSRLVDGRLAIATRQDGVLIFARDGSIDQVVSTEAGLPEAVLTSAFADREGSLWLTFDGGIVRVDLASPLSLLDARRGLRGSITDLIRHNDRLYLSGSHGLYTLDSDESAAAGIARPVAGIPVSAWSLVSRPGELLIATATGVYRLPDRGPPAVIAETEKQIVYCMYLSPSDPTRIWLGTRTGLGILRHRDGAWHFDGLFRGGRPYIRSMVEVDGVLWCGTTFHGILRVGPDGVKEYGEDEMNVTTVGGRVVFVTSDGRVLHLSRDEHLEVDPILGRMSAPGGYFLMLEDRHRNVWINSIPPRVFHRRADGSYDPNGEPLVAMTVGDIQVMRAEREGVVWFCADRGLFRYEAARATASFAQPPPMIRRVIAGDNHLLDGGFGTRGDRVELPPTFGRVRIEFAPASFRPGVFYQFRLDPADGDWSAWSEQPFIDYTHLVENQYTFRVRARGPAGNVSPAVAWSFTVLPPWYRTPWAIALWGIAAAVLLLLVVLVSTRALRRQAERLRTRVAEQTVELRRTVDQLREAQDALVNKNVQLEQANARLESLSLLDDLTAIANRRYFQRALAAEWDRALRRQQPVALALLDLDFFKELNDSRGHPAGDDCLRQIGRFLKEAVRGSGDVVARYGGEEFAILLPGANGDEGVRIAERLRIGIESLAIPYDEPDDRVMTASCGVAAIIPTGTVESDVLIDRADRALYAAKHDGRNCVRMASESTKGTWLRDQAG